MKKFTLLLLCFPIALMAQTIKPAPQLKLAPAKNQQVARVQLKTMVNDAVRPENFTPVYPAKSHYNSGSVRDITSTQIGTTTYDLETNGSIYPRMLNNGDGTWSAVWTMSKNASWSDRGTGYNYFDGTTWGTQPSARLEAERCGFTNICYSANGNEIVLSHTAVGTNPSEPSLVTRTPKGTGTWSETTSALTSPSTGMLWMRMARGGTDNNTIHVIGLTQPTANPPGTVYKGQDGALLYSRSTDGGNTWDKIQVDLPGIDSSNYLGFDGDAYAIDANGNNVAIAIGGFRNDWLILKSTDNGDTWTKTIVMQFPIPFFDFGQLSDTNEDGVADTIDTNDGSVAVLVDHNGVVHTWAGYNRIFNDGTTTGYFYFPGTNGLMYWNDDTQGTPTIIVGALDLDGSGTLDISSLASSYGCGLCSFPSAGEDAFGNIYLSYWAIIENTADPSGNSLGNSYLIYSQDEGTTWSSFDGESGPVDFTTPDGVSEGCYSSIERNVDDVNIHIVTMEDACAGQGVTTDPNTGDPLDPCNTGETNIILAVTIPNFITGIPSVTNTIPDIKVYPVPSEGNFTIDGITDQKVNISITNSLGQIITRFDNQKVNGHSVELNLSSLADGFYNVNLENNGQTISKKITVYKQN